MWVLRIKLEKPRVWHQAPFLSLLALVPFLFFFLPPFDTCTHNPPSFCLSPLSTKPRLASDSAPPASVCTVRPALLPLFAHPALAPSPCSSGTLRLQRGTLQQPASPSPRPRRPCTGLRVTRPRPARSCFSTRLGRDGAPRGPRGSSRPPGPWPPLSIPAASSGIPKQPPPSPVPT